MAEFLIRAQGHWLDDYTKTQALSAFIGAVTSDSYDARTQKGDIIAIRPDGVKWGKSETLPEYIIIKVPGLDPKTASNYLESIVDTSKVNGKSNYRVLKHHKWKVPENYVDGVVRNGGVATITNQVLLNRFEEKLI